MTGLAARAKGWAEGALFLAVDTCGLAGSAALGRVEAGPIAILGEAVLPAGGFSTQLLPVIDSLLRGAAASISGLAGITVVSGPGSFTGVRIGLATVKGLAEAASLPVVAVSRLALLADQAQAPIALLDAHRGQFFAGFFAESPGAIARETLLTAGEINTLGGLSGRVAICEESVAQMLEELQGEPELVRVAPPTAADALRFSAALWQAGDLSDPATLDGHYLRGADAKVAARQTRP